MVVGCGSAAVPPAPPPLRPDPQAIIGIDGDSVETLVVLAAGRKDGVTEQSHAEIAHVECMVVGVSERSTKCKVKLTPDQVKVAGTKIRVRF
jgi:hypothetical protein